MPHCLLKSAKRGKIETNRKGGAHRDQNNCETENDKTNERRAMMKRSGRRSKLDLDPVMVDIAQYLNDELGMDNPADDVNESIEEVNALDGAKPLSIQDKSTLTDMASNIKEKEVLQNSENSENSETENDAASSDYDGPQESGENDNLTESASVIAEGHRVNNATTEEVREVLSSAKGVESNRVAKPVEPSSKNEVAANGADITEPSRTVNKQSPKAISNSASTEKFEVVNRDSLKHNATTSNGDISKSTVQDRMVELEKEVDVEDVTETSLSSFVNVEVPDTKAEISLIDSDEGVSPPVDVSSPDAGELGVDQMTAELVSSERKMEAENLVETDTASVSASDLKPDHFKILKTTSPSLDDEILSENAVTCNIEEKQSKEDDKSAVTDGTTLKNGIKASLAAGATVSLNQGVEDGKEKEITPKLEAGEPKTSDPNVAVEDPSTHIAEMPDGEVEVEQNVGNKLTESKAIHGKPVEHPVDMISSNPKEHSHRDSLENTKEETSSEKEMPIVLAAEDDFDQPENVEVIVHPKSSVETVEELSSPDLATKEPQPVKEVATFLVDENERRTKGEGEEPIVVVHDSLVKETVKQGNNEDEELVGIKQEGSLKEKREMGSVEDAQLAPAEQGASAEKTEKMSSEQDGKATISVPGSLVSDKGEAAKVEKLDAVKQGASVEEQEKSGQDYDEKITELAQNSAVDEIEKSDEDDKKLAAVNRGASVHQPEELGSEKNDEVTGSEHKPFFEAKQEPGEDTPAKDEKESTKAKEVASVGDAIADVQSFIDDAVKKLVKTDLDDEPVVVTRKDLEDLEDLEDVQVGTGDDVSSGIPTISEVPGTSAAGAEAADGFKSILDQDTEELLAKLEMMDDSALSSLLSTLESDKSKSKTQEASHIIRTSEIRAENEKKPIYIYTSLAGGGFHMIPRTNRLVTILTANRVQFEYRDMGTDPEAKRVWRLYSQQKTLPGIVRGRDDFIGNWQDIEEANEDYKLRELLYDTI